MDFTTVVVVFFDIGFFLPALLIVSRAFLDSAAARSFASIKRSVAFRLRVPSTMSAGFSPGLELGAWGIVWWDARMAQNAMDFRWVQFLISNVCTVCS
jgi:hypothetical protein